MSISHHSSTSYQPTIANDKFILACRVIPPKTLDRDPVVLETAMHSLVLDADHPLALEITGGTAQGRQLIMRATTIEALEHAKMQLLARYPQARCEPLSTNDDPFFLHGDEALSTAELTAGSPSYLPLQTFDEKMLDREGQDPLLGVLAALEHLPPGVRAITQLALVPAAPDWGKGNYRKAVEHPLEPERARQQVQLATSRAGAGGPSWISILGMVMLLGAFLLYRALQPSLPIWANDAIASLLRGHLPVLAEAHTFLFWGTISGVFLSAFLLFVLIDQIRRRFTSTPLYDMHLIAQKTSQMAYRVRLRLYVIGPQSPTASTPSSWHAVSFTWYGWQMNTINHNGRTLLLFLHSTWVSFRQRQKEKARRHVILLRLIAAYRQFHLASGAYFVPKMIAEHTALHLVPGPKRSHANWSRTVHRSTHHIGVATLPALWHMLPPRALSEASLLEYRRARSLPISPLLAHACEAYLSVYPQRIMGYNEHAGFRIPFVWMPSFSSQHTLIMGKSGEGKSTLIEHIAAQAMRDGGLVLLDPHGDLVDRVLGAVPAWKVEQVVLIDLADPLFSIGLNPLDVTLGRTRDKTTADLIHAFSHLYKTSWGPRMEIVFDIVVKTLMAYNEYLVIQDPANGPTQQLTLLSVLPILTNESFCNTILSQITDPYLHRWWRSYYKPLSTFMQRDRIDPVLTKMAKFESVIARRILGQAHSTIHFSQLVAEEKIILVKLAKGVVGEDATRILGATIVGLIQTSLEEQAMLNPTTRKRYPIILDEFQTFAGIDYAAIAELRKYGASFFLGTQSLEYLFKLDPQLPPTVLANTRQIIAFHVSAQDAHTLYRELDVDENDLLTLEQHMCYAKLTYGSFRQPTFSMRLELPLSGERTIVDDVRQRSRQQYAQPVDLIDRTLLNAVLKDYGYHASKGSYHATAQASHPLPTETQSTVLVTQTSTSTPLPPEVDESDEEQESDATVPHEKSSSVQVIEVHQQTVETTQEDEQSMLNTTLPSPTNRVSSPSLTTCSSSSEHQEAQTHDTVCPPSLDHVYNGNGHDNHIFHTDQLPPDLLAEIFTLPEADRKSRYRGRKSEKLRRTQPRDDQQLHGQRSSTQIRPEGVSESDLAALGIRLTTPPQGEEESDAIL